MKVLHVAEYIAAPSSDKTSLDELPQLWNVLKGEMSLVGPRPIVQAEVERYDKFIKEYYSVLPGITGMWQTSGRSDIDLSRKSPDGQLVRPQLECLAGYGTAWRTVAVVVKHKGAY